MSLLPRSSAFVVIVSMSAASSSMEALQESISSKNRFFTITVNETLKNIT